MVCAQLLDLFLRGKWPCSLQLTKELLTRHDKRMNIHVSAGLTHCLQVLSLFGRNGSARIWPCFAQTSWQKKALKDWRWALKVLF